MSYILDALRRADADRARGAVPGLGAQPMGIMQVPLGEPRRSARVWWVAGVLVLMSVGVALVWRTRGPIEVAETGLAAAVQEPVAQISARPAQEVNPPVPPPLLVQGDTRASTPLPARGDAVQAKGASMAVSSAASSSAAPSERLVPGAPVAVAALPSDIRNSFPHLKVGGGMYSPQKASRLVVLNDQVWREGDVVMPGLVLLEITPTEVIFSFRAYRVSVKL